MSVDVFNLSAKSITTLKIFNYNYYLKMLDNFLDKPTACCRIESEHLGANL